MQKIFFLMLPLLFIQSLFADDMQISIHDDLQLLPVAKNIYIHVSWVDYPGYGRISANGLIILDDQSAVLIDTPWNNKITEVLYIWLRQNWGVTITTVIPTHYHEDCLGGLPFLHSKDVVSYGFQKTIEICKNLNIEAPKNSFNRTLTLQLSKLTIKAQFLGEGHTKDTISVYIPEEKIVFGGCSVKAKNNNTLGNTADASLKEWPGTIKKMIEEYKNAEIIIPGHGQKGSLELLHHTLDLCK